MITHNLAQNDTSTDDKGGCDEIIIMVFLVFAKLWLYIHPKVEYIDYRL